MEKPGIKTTEFWVSTLTIVAGSIISLLVTYNVLNSEEASAWMRVLVSFIPLIAMILSAWVATNYTGSRTEVKVEGQKLKTLELIEELEKIQR